MLMHLTEEGLFDFSNPSIHALIEEKAGVGTWLQDLRSMATLWSRGMYNLLGVEPTVPASWTTVEELIHPEDREAARELAQHAVGDRLPAEQEFRVLRPNGTIRWLTSRREILFTRTGEARFMIGVLVDNTARIDASRRHAALEEHRRQLARIAASVTWTASADGDWFDSLQWRDLTGQGVVQSSGRGWLDVVHPEDREALRASWDAAVAGGTPFEARFRLRTAAGDDRWFLARGAPMLDELGAVREWVGLCVDVHALVAGVPGDRSEVEVLSGALLRAGRGALNWSVHDMAQASGLTPGVIRRLEASRATSLADPALSRLSDTLASAGVRFAPDGEGVLLRLA